MANQVNPSGKNFGRSKINSGDVNRTAPWSFSSEDGNACLGPDGNDWTNYGRHHLGMDSSQSRTTKAHWKYPFAKGGTVYRSGLIAVKQRAGGQGDTEILNAADDLLQMIDKNDETNDLNNVLQFNKSENKSFLKLHAQSSSDIIQMDMLGIVGGGFFGDGITKEKFAKTLRDIPKSTKRVTLRLSSPGGDVFEGRTIANMIKDHPAAFDVNVMAEACSIASIIAMAGDTIHMSEGSVMLVHRCYTLAMGNSQEMLKLAKDLEVIDQEMVKTYKNKTNMSESDIVNLMDENRYMNAEEAKKLGFVDSISESYSNANASSLMKIAAFNIDRSKFHLPPLPNSSESNKKAALAALNRIKEIRSVI